MQFRRELELETDSERASLLNGIKSPLHATIILPPFPSQSCHHQLQLLNVSSLGCKYWEVEEFVLFSAVSQRVWHILGPLFKRGRWGKAEPWGTPKPMGLAAREDHQRDSQSNHQNKRRTAGWAFASSQDAPVLQRFPTCPIPALPRETSPFTVQGPGHSPSSRGWLEQRWTLNSCVHLSVMRFWG